MKTIQYKSKGTEVKIIQTFLEVEIDGIFGRKTEKAVNSWKIGLGMEPDGIIYETDWNIIAQILPTIKIGNKSKYTTMWQLYLGITADGIFGSQTKASTRAFQSTANLVIDGIVGLKTWKLALTSPNCISNNLKVTSVQPIDYKQYDSRWGGIRYSTHTSTQTIKNSGCGPTSAADIIATWWDKKITPKETCALSVANGYRTENNGTAWGFFKFIANKYKASKFIQTISIATLKQALQEGAYAVVSFRPSKWTKGGHFCCIWKWDGKYFYINDPASSSSSRAKGTEKEVQDAAKQFFIFYK